MISSQVFTDDGDAKRTSDFEGILNLEKSKPTFSF
jgi:hypothetical protein